ncbi:hypothetical protein SAMN04488128_107222 [Chitinophaga eiseniae]|uniref:Uncharacterized protein n=1 Tax=Chitinophaga eiseniae TaxID=634771 RepID=A0A1T4U0I2_9BACT|nr:hypothetical protein [Chitinophaga eiseniae]SKA46204.1 hypothetical protein SAMN04488128_107222 [Chitinophaga eiseniae]
MGYISKPQRKSIFSGEHRISSILRDELKMHPSAARELLLEMDNVLNDRLQEIVQYGNSIHQEIDKVDQEVFRDFGGITWRIIYWIVILGIPFFLFLLALIGNHQPR